MSNRELLTQEEESLHIETCKAIHWVQPEFGTFMKTFLDSPCQEVSEIKQLQKLELTLSPRLQK